MEQARQTCAKTLLVLILLHSLTLLRERVVSIDIEKSKIGHN